MDTPAERKRMLIAMKADILEQFESVKAKLDAVELLITSQDENEPDPPVATVEEIRKASMEILATAGQPIHRNTLLEALDDRGVQVGGKIPVNKLGSVLSRFSKDFESHGQGMWSWNNKPTSAVGEAISMNGYNSPSAQIPINSPNDVFVHTNNGVYDIRSS